MTSYDERRDEAQEEIGKERLAYLAGLRVANAALDDAASAAAAAYEVAHQTLDDWDMEEAERWTANGGAARILAYAVKTMHSEEDEAAPQWYGKPLNQWTDDERAAYARDRAAFLASRDETPAEFFTLDDCIVCDHCHKPMIPNLSTDEGDGEGYGWSCTTYGCGDFTGEQIEAEDLVACGCPQWLAERMQALSDACLAMLDDAADAKAAAKAAQEREWDAKVARNLAAKKPVHLDRHVYHCAIVDDSSPGGISTALLFAEALPFKVEVVSLSGVDEERLAEALNDDDEGGPLVVNKYGTDSTDSEGWMWDGDSVAQVIDASEFAARIFSETPNDFARLCGDHCQDDDEGTV